MERRRSAMSVLQIAAGKAAGGIAIGAGMGRHPGADHLGGCCLQHLLCGGPSRSVTTARNGMPARHAASGASGTVELPRSAMPSLPRAARSRSVAAAMSASTASTGRRWNAARDSARQRIRASGSTPGHSPRYAAARQWSAAAMSMTSRGTAYSVRSDRTDNAARNPILVAIEDADLAIRWRVVIDARGRGLPVERALARKQANHLPDGGCRQVFLRWPAVAGIAGA